MKFGEAITLIEAGHKLTRLSWHNRNEWLAIVSENEVTRGSETHITKKWIGIKTITDYFMPWVPSQSDMLTNDWILYDDSRDNQLWGNIFGKDAEAIANFQAENNRRLRELLDQETFASAPVKAEGEPVSYDAANPTPRKSKKAPWGFKKDGTPKKRPGRKVEGF